MAETNRPDNSCDADGGDAPGPLTPEMLVRRHASAVMGVCLANTRSFHDAEDVMQDVFLKAFTKLHRLRDPGRVRSWLLQIARRTCVDYSRRRRPAYAISENVPAGPESIETPIARLHAAIAQLPHEYRETISLYYLDGRKCPAIADSLGISEAAVRQRLVRARLMLHDVLGEEEP